MDREGFQFGTDVYDAKAGAPKGLDLDDAVALVESR